MGGWGEDVTSGFPLLLMLNKILQHYPQPSTFSFPPSHPLPKPFESTLFNKYLLSIVCQTLGWLLSVQRKTKQTTLLEFI